MGKFSAAIDVFRKGSEVANVEAWKNHQMKGNMVGLFILASLGFAKAMGWIEATMEKEDALLIGGAVVALWNWVCTVASSKRAGILPAKPAAAEQPVQPAGTEAGADERVPTPTSLPSGDEPDPFENKVRF